MTSLSDSADRPAAAPGPAMGMRNRAVFLLARLVPNLLGVLTTAVLTRLLDPALYGFYALGLSLIYFLTIGVFEWLALSLLRIAPKSEQPDRFFGVVMSFFAGLCAATLVVAALVIAVAGLAAYLPLTLAALAAGFAQSWFELRQRLQLAELRAGDYFWTSAGRGALTITLVCATAYFYRSAPPILLALAASSFLASLTRREPRLDLRRARFDPDATRALLQFGLPLSLSIGVGTLLALTDKWMLQGLVGPGAVGLFAAACAVAQMPIFALASGVGPSAYSMAVRAHEFGSPEAVRLQLSQNFVILLGIVAPAAAGIVAVANNLAHLIVGAAYWEAAVRLAPWLAAGAAVASMRSFYIDIAFQLGHRTLRLIWTMLATLAADLVLDLWLIPHYGELGAAMGSFGGVMAGLVVGIATSVSAYRLPLPVADSLKVLVSTAAMYAALRAFPTAHGAIALACQVGGGAAVYAAGVILSNVGGTRGWLIRRWRRGW